MLYSIICEANDKKVWIKSNYFSVCEKKDLRDLLKSITYEHILSYAERINDPAVEKYWNVLEKAKKEE